MSEKDFIGFTLSKLQEVGPRPSASSKEWDFLRFIRERLESLGITTGWEAFPAPSSYTWGHLFLWLGMAQAGFLLWVAPLWSLIWSMVVLFLEYAELATFPLVSALFRFGESANVVGENGENPEVVIMAHVDSARCSLFFHPRFVTNPRLSLLLLVYSSVCITGSSLLFVLFRWGILFWVGLFPSFYLAFLALGHLHREFFMGFSPGGNDNGSGVVAALEIARVLRGKGVPFWVVFTGAEESGTWGALHFLKRYGSLLSKKPILNLDSIGTGKLTVATKEGMWKVYRAAPHLVQEFKKLRDTGLHFRPYLGLFTDATPFLARGFEALTIIALGENGLPVNWHWYTDTVGKVTEENLRQVVAVVTEWVEKRRGLPA